MKAVLQRVKEASVTINGKLHSSIGEGLLILLGVGPDDGQPQIEYLARKIINMRIFYDEQGKFNHSLLDVGGEALVVSQFTLFADCKKGNRPSYGRAAPPDLANDVYEKFVSHLEGQLQGRVKTGVFAADMKVALLNDGPVTISLDTAELLTS